MAIDFRATPFESAFPQRLRRVARLPDLVEATGPFATELSGARPSVAIVGTREPPHEARGFARALAATLASAGVVIVSGGAYGIDAGAHEGALDAGGTTVAVLPGGIDVACPSGHRDLFARIARTGALVAIRPRGTPPHRGYFLQRNAIIAALADHVVLVAAPIQSGARSTTAAARRMGVPVWIVPGPPWVPALAGAALELELGARPLAGAGPILEALGILPPDTPVADVDEPRSVPAAIRPPSLPTRRGLHPRERLGFGEPTVAPVGPYVAPFAVVDDVAKLILGRLAAGGATLDELVDSTALSVSSVRGLLLTWTVEGVVREGPAGFFRLVTARN